METGTVTNRKGGQVTSGVGGIYTRISPTPFYVKTEGLFKLIVKTTILYYVNIFVDLDKILEKISVLDAYCC